MTSYFHEEQRLGSFVWAVIALSAVLVVAITIEVAMRDLSRVLPLMLGPPGILVAARLPGFARLVTDVDQTGVHVNFHLLWPARHIPIDDIKRAQATAYN